MSGIRSDTLCLGDNSLVCMKLEIIGRGGFGLVWKALRKGSSQEIPTDHYLAVKEIHLSSVEIERLQVDVNGKEVLRRWKSLFDLEHPNVLRYYQVTVEKMPYGGTVNLAMEFMADGDLDCLLSQLRKEEITQTPTTLLHMAEQLTFGLDYLHQHSIIHGDLKPANVLIKPCPRRQWILIIADLDDRIQMEENVTKSLDVTKIHGTARYMSPEMVARFLKQGSAKPGRKTDVWSLGCVILDLADCLYGNQQRLFWKKRLFSTDSFTISADTTREQILIKIASGYIPVVPPELPSDLADIIGRCLVANAAERISADALLLTMRHFLYKAVKAKSSALFREVYYVAEDDFLQHAESDDGRLFELKPIVWTWLPNRYSIGVAEEDHILVKYLETHTETSTAFPAAPKFPEKDETSPFVSPRELDIGRKSHQRKNCLLLSFNATGTFVCVGFEFDLPPVTVLEMWRQNTTEFVGTDVITSKSFFITNWSTQWTADGSCFAAVSINPEECAPCLYVWTKRNMRFREITSDMPFRVVQWFFVDGCTTNLYDSNGDCYVCDGSASTGLAKRKCFLDIEPGTSQVQQDSEIQVTRFAIQKGNVMVELVAGKTGKQGCIFRMRNGQDGHIQTEASLDWPYAAVVRCTGNDSSGCDQMSVVCFCLRLPESKNADPHSQFHLWMWNDRKKMPVLLNSDLVDGRVLSVSPDSRRIVAIVKMAAADHSMPALSIWDTVSEGTLWIIWLPSSYHPFSDLQWNSTSDCIAFTAWSKSFDKIFSRKRLLVLELSKCERGITTGIQPKKMVR